MPNHRTSLPSVGGFGSDDTTERRPVSCERCKRRKCRCDRQTPSCQRCEAAGVACEYLDRRKPGFPTGQRQVLEDKISLAQAHNRPASAIPALNSDTSELSQTPMNLDPEEPPRQTTEQPPLATSTRTANITEQKPPMDLVVSLVSLFFRHIHTWLPFLSAQRVFDEMGSTQEPSLLHYALFGVSLPFSFDSRLNQQSADAFWKYSKRRIFIEILEEPSYTALEALTVLVLDLSGMTNGPQVWGALAVATKLALQLKPDNRHVFRASTGAPTDEPLVRPDQIHQHRLFWAIYALDCYISMTTSHPSELTDSHFREFLYTREVSWRDPQDIRLLMTPQGQTQPKQPHETGATATPRLIFSYQLELLEISKRLHAVYVDYITLPIEETGSSDWLQRFVGCSTRLSEWFQTLPQCLHLDTSNQPQTSTHRTLPSALMLHAYYHASTIYLNGLMAFPFEESLYAQRLDFRKDSQDTCMRSVESMVEICSSATDKVRDSLGWPFAWSVWVAARYLLVSEYNGCCQSPQYFDILLQSVKKMARYWQISRKYWLLLHQAETELRNSRLSGNRTQSGVLPSLVDLRIATCDLEDKFRADPFLHETQVAGEQTTTSYENPAGFEASLRNTDLQSSLPTEPYFSLSGQESSNWFTVPLFALSTYQQSPGSFGSADGFNA
ncbi:hypothetical protein BKA56DRAFT_695198 [Ilyonectria sp. MPI-CAGE-AT-0026]|nr:hypothetical protein BKA56DRAFT_695198 [Ilyonectria sp. MPI-CAGE-AT-0026]